MVSRTYAQIECSLTGSKRIRQLSGHSAKWAYVCAHLSSFCTYTGLFKYPPEIWAHDAQMSREELGSAISEMVKAGLIEHDPQEDYVRIIGWFHKRSGPDNPNRVDSVISDLSRMDDIGPQMYCRVASELAVASVKRSLRWKADAPGWERLYGSLKQFLSEVYQDYGTAFLSILKLELDKGPMTVCAEISALMPVLAIQMDEGLSKGSGRVTPTLSEHETRRNVNETNTKQKKDETETTHFPKLEFPQSDADIERSEGLRKGQCPTKAAFNSAMSIAARRGT